MARDYCKYREFYSEESLEEMVVKLNDSKYLCMSMARLCKRISNRIMSSFNASWL